MIADQFHAGGYFMQDTTDMINFTKVDKNRFSIDHLKARHGSVMHITEEEYNRLSKHFLPMPIAKRIETFINKLLSKKK